jgi:hypothetical protein
MFISQTGLTYFYKWPTTCEIQILNLMKCGSRVRNNSRSMIGKKFLMIDGKAWSETLGMLFQALVEVGFATDVTRGSSFSFLSPHKDLPRKEPLEPG